MGQENRWEEERARVVDRHREVVSVDQCLMLQFLSQSCLREQISAEECVIAMFFVIVRYLFVYGIASNALHVR